VSRVQSWTVQSDFPVEQLVSVILDCNYDFCVFNISIKVIRKPLIISDATHTLHNMKSSTFSAVTSVYRLPNLTSWRIILFLATRKRHKFWRCGSTRVMLRCRSTETATQPPKTPKTIVTSDGMQVAGVSLRVLIHSSVQIWIHHKRKQTHPCVCEVLCLTPVTHAYCGYNVQTWARIGSSMFRSAHSTRINKTATKILKLANVILILTQYNLRNWKCR
jgi:hypothetical protein